MRRLVRDEGGWTLIASMVVMSILLASGFAAVSFVDGLSRESGQERVRETSYNAAESLLQSDVLILSSGWPTSGAVAPPATCSQVSAAGSHCPSATELAAAFAGTDVSRAPTTWSTQVRDNQGTAATVYDRTALDATSCGGVTPCTWDANQDGVVWVRSSATVGSRTRTVIAQVRRQQQRIGFPRATIVADHFSTSNSGLKTIVDTSGCAGSTPCTASSPGPVMVRCSSPTAGTTGDNCLGYRTSQVSPASTSMGYQGNVLTPAQIETLKQRAIRTGSYYTTCPSAAQIQSAPADPDTGSGPVVYIQGVSCSYNSNSVFNSPAEPGVLVLDRATIALNGTLVYYGVVYAVNGFTPPADTQDLVMLSGTALIQGAVFVEGRGGIQVGSSAMNVSFDPNVLGNILGDSSLATIVQGTFRELPAGR